MEKGNGTSTTDERPIKMLCTAKKQLHASVVDFASQTFFCVQIDAQQEEKSGFFLFEQKVEKGGVFVCLWLPRN